MALPRLSERAITRLLAGVCVAGLVVTLAPRLTVRRAPLEVVQPPITVSVRGEVAEPGVYQLSFGARAADLVAAAGGALPSAALTLMSLSDPLTDGESLLVPGIAAADGRGERVSINTASPALLDTLPGIGPVMAERIVAQRPFDTIDDLLRVPGIGPRTLERLVGLVGL